MSVRRTLFNTVAPALFVVASFMPSARADLIMEISAESFEAQSGDFNNGDTNGLTGSKLEFSGLFNDDRYDEYSGGDFHHDASFLDLFNVKAVGPGDVTIGTLNAVGGSLTVLNDPSTDVFVLRATDLTVTGAFADYDIGFAEFAGFDPTAFILDDANPFYGLSPLAEGGVDYPNIQFGLFGSNDNRIGLIDIERTSLDAAAVPEPNSLILMSLAVAGGAAMHRRRRRISVTSESESTPSLDA